MSAAPIIRLADEDSRIGLVNSVHALATKTAGDLTLLLDGLEQVRTLEPTLFRDPEVTAKISQVRAAQHELQRALSACWDEALGGGA